MALVRRLAVLLLPILAACGSGDRLIAPEPAGPTPPSTSRSFVVPRSLAGAPGLTRPQTMRAIAIRSRIARNHRPPTEQVIREYAVDGSVQAERVRTAEGWVERPSTLPADLAIRPLASYLTTDHASLNAGAAVMQTMVSVDTVDNVPITNTDTLWNYASSTMSLSVRESSAAGFSWIGDVYYNGPGDVGAIELSTSGAIFTEIPGDDGFLEATLNATDWTSAKAEVAALPEFPGWPSTSGSLRTDRNDALLMALALGYLADEDPCFHLFVKSGLSAAGALVAGAAAFETAAVPAVGRFFAKSAVGLLVGAIGYGVAYRQCRHDNPPMAEVLSATP